MSEPLLSIIDGPALIAAVRAGDPVAIDKAYKVTFGHDLGRLVLAHHLHECGVGQPLGAKDLKFKAGRIDAALDLAARAGFDPAAVAVAVLTDSLQEESDAGSTDYHIAPLGDEFDG